MSDSGRVPGGGLGGALARIAGTLRATVGGGPGCVPGDGDKSPLFVKGGPRGVLCLHGFTGTPFEVRPLAEGFAQRGYTVSAPVIAGHGGSLEELARTRWPDWLRSAEAALDGLLAAVGGGPVAVAGFSMGGLLSIRLARLRPRDVGVLAVMAAPLRLKRFEATAVRLLSHLPTPLRRGPIAYLPKTGGFDVTDEEMRRRNPGQPAMPLVGVRSLLDLAEIARRDLPFVKQPTLVAHGERDRTVPFEDSLELVGSLAAETVERLWLPRSGHLLALDVERAELVTALDRFFTGQMPGLVARERPTGKREASS